VSAGDALATVIRAELFETHAQNRVQCLLCAHQCNVPDGGVGICRVRKNIGGTLYSMNSDRVAAVHLDPIEKKPLYHFLPGSSAFSIAAMGCNFACRFCQNHSLSVVESEQSIGGENISPEQLVRQAGQVRAASIAYTYSEPTVFFELMAETARLARQQGIKNVMVSNGYMTSLAVQRLGPLMDAANIDLKAFSEDFYSRYCSARLQPVLETIAALRSMGVWLEVTTLLIPGLNDDREEVRRLISFLLDLGGDTPWHVSRFFPQYRLREIPRTDPSVIRETLELGAEMGLKFLYSGNVAADCWSDSRCPNCGHTLIRRQGYQTDVPGLKGGKCMFCGNSIPGVWKE
jgi:pyruvate formate lyase activating enzyme